MPPILTVLVRTSTVMLRPSPVSPSAVDSTVASPLDSTTSMSDLSNALHLPSASLKVISTPYTPFPSLPAGKKAVTFEPIADTSRPATRPNGPIIFNDTPSTSERSIGEYVPVALSNTDTTASMVTSLPRTILIPLCLQSHSLFMMYPILFREPGQSPCSRLW